MASFAPNLPDQSNSVPNYEGMSQAPSLREAMYAHRGMETLFSGIGTAVSGAARAANDSIDEGIRKDVYQGVDPLRNAQIGQPGQSGQSDVFGSSPQPDAGPSTPASSSAGPLSANVPPNTNAVQGTISKLTQAFQQGKIGDTYYYGQLDSLTRQLKSKYPGYRDDVDQMIQSVTGITPANALRRSILQDLQKGQNDAKTQANKYQTYLSENEKYLPPGFWKDPSKFSETDVHAYVTSQKANDYQVQQTQARIAQQLDQNKLNINDAQTGATQGLSILYNKMSNDTTMAGGGLSALMNQINTARASGENLTPEKQQALSSAFGIMKSNYLTQVDGFLNKPFGKNGESYASILGPEKTKAIRDGAISRMDSVGQYLTDQNFGALTMNSRFTQAMSDHDGRALLEKYEPLRKLNAVANLKGSQNYLPIVMQNSGGALGGVVQALSDAVSNKRRVDGSNPTQDIQDIHNAGKQIGPGGEKAYIKGLELDLTRPEAPDAVMKKSAYSMFSPENRSFLQYFKPDERSDLFTRLTSPEITKRIAGTGDKQLWSNYTEWAKNAFVGVFKEAGSEIQESGNKNWYDVRFDPKANQFLVSPTPLGISTAKDRGFFGSNPMQVLNPSLMTSVNKINQGLKTLEPIMKHDGYDVSTELGNLLHNEGFMPSSNASPFLTKARNALSQKGLDPYFGGTLINMKAGQEVVKPEDQIDYKSAFEGNQKSLLDTIAKGEGTSGSNGYDVAYGGHNFGLTHMSLGQVMEFQQHMKNGGQPSTAVGRYQVIDKTLKRVIGEMKLSPDTKFTPELQDRIAVQLLKDRGYDNYKAGKLSPEDFQDQLAQEWASVPTRSGKSFYEGDGLNHAHLTPQAMRQVLADKG